MPTNPYEPPQEVGEQPKRFRDRHFFGYLWALLIGALLGGLLLTGPLADLDDAGGLQMLIGAAIGIVVYRMLF